MSWTVHKELSKFLSQYESQLFEYEDHNNMFLQALSRAIQNPTNENLAFTDSQGAIAVFLDGSLLFAEGASGEASTLASTLAEVLKFNPKSKLLKAIGPEVPIQKFTRSWLQLNKEVKIKRQMAMVLQKLTTVNQIPKVQGHFRRAWIEEVNQLAGWIKGFWEDTGVGQETPLTETEVAQQMITGKQLFVWANPRAVSMAGVGGSTPKGIRVHSVYTPPKLRGQGLAKATVASVSQFQLDQGKDFLVLYSDALKPENTKLYKDVGYEPIANHLGFFFE